MRRRGVSPFSLSFVDSILCGFGAVILLFLILSSHSVAERREATQDLRSKVERLEQAVLEGRKQLVVLRNSVEETRAEQQRVEGLSERIIRSIEERTLQLAELDKDNLATQEHINRLKADLKSREEGTKRLEAGARERAEQGERLREFPGEGDRQYLTDLKVGGKRILILVDTSASMLGESIVDVIRRRNLPEADRRQAPKWQRALKTVDWLTAQLPPSAEFQIYSFNEQAVPIIEGTAGRWLKASDVVTLDKAVAGLRRRVPEKGTSLYQAVVALRAMSPKPDNVFLITDGLPTVGRSRGMGQKVSGKQRLSHFRRAVEQLPAGIPVNIILFPMEGDPMAASAYWQLARASRGSLMSPSRDWP